jgi:hypothetical protein
MRGAGATCRGARRAPPFTKPSRSKAATCTAAHTGRDTSGQIRLPLQGCDTASAVCLCMTRMKAATCVAESAILEILRWCGRRGTGSLSVLHRCFKHDG